jgi:hypothetical protein
MIHVIFCVALDNFNYFLRLGVCSAKVLQIISNPHLLTMTGLIKKSDQLVQFYDDLLDMFEDPHTSVHFVGNSNYLVDVGRILSYQRLDIFLNRKRRFYVKFKV